jgi:hypothetical protein
MWFIGQGGKPRKNLPRTAEDIAMEESIKERVAYLKGALLNLPSESIVFDVCDMIEQWRLDLTMSHLDQEDETFRVAISRGFIHAYKIAVMFAMTDPAFQKQVLLADPTNYPIHIQIPDRNAIEAIGIVEKYLIPRTMYVYELCNQSDERNHQIQILKAIDHFGGAVERTRLLRKTHMNSKDMTISLKTLEESGEVKIHKRTNGATRPSEIIIKL